MFDRLTVAAIMFVVSVVLALYGSRISLAADHPFTADVFVSGTEDYHTFRIPTLMVTGKGTVLAFCEGRKTSRADLGNNDLMLKRSTDVGRTWGKLQLVYEEGGDKKITIGNPTAVVDRDTGTLWLIFLRNASDVLVTKSSDDGRSWSKPEIITQQVKNTGWGFYAVGPGVGIQLRFGPHKGRLVIPAYHRTTGDKSGPSAANVFFSDDHGQTWRLGGTVGPHTNECQVVETMVADKSALMINTRNHWARSGGRRDLAGRRTIARSHDGGQSWSKPEFDTTLIEPTCQASLLRYSWPDKGNKSRILFANPASNSRRNMTVRLSYDDGKTWPVKKTVYKASAAYSCLAVLPRGGIGLIYERDDYARITFTSFTLDWLTDGNDSPGPR